MSIVVKDYTPEDGYYGAMRYSAGKANIKYVAKKDGVYKEWDDVDQFGEPMFRLAKMVLPKEAFIAAYNAYIKDGESL